MAKKVVDDWRVVGSVGGLAALIMLLVQLTKLKPIDDLLKAKGLKWLRPVLAVVAGVITGAAGSMAVGSGILPGAINGFFIGASAVGMHELKAARERESLETKESA